MRYFITKIKRFFFLKARRGSCINKEDSPRGEGKQFQLHKLSSSSSSSFFANLIIRETAITPRNLYRYKLGKIIMTEICICIN